MSELDDLLGWPLRQHAEAVRLVGDACDQDGDPLGAIQVWHTWVTLTEPGLGTMMAWTWRAVTAAITRLDALVGERRALVVAGELVPWDLTVQLERYAGRCGDYERVYEQMAYVAAGLAVPDGEKFDGKGCAANPDMDTM